LTATIQGRNHDHRNAREALSGSTLRLHNVLEALRATQDKAAEIPAPKFQEIAGDLALIVEEVEGIEEATIRATIRPAPRHKKATLTEQ
jgi:hypothetical protein